MLTLSLPGFAQSPLGATVKEIRIPAGKTVDLWLGINVSGKVNYAIHTKSGSNAMRMWWILGPTGRVRQLGKISGDGSLTIPGLATASISAKLRGSATEDTTVYIGENVSIDHSLTFHW
jgi:hypothetical protein